MRKNNNENKPKIVATRKSNAGIITDVKLNDGRVLSKQKAILVAKKEGIEGVNVGRTRGENRAEILRANPTNDPSKALSNLPSF